MENFVSIWQQPYAWLALASFVCLAFMLAVLRNWRAARAGRSPFDIDIVVLGTTGAGKTCFLSALMDKIVSAHALPDNVCAYYLANNQERLLRRLPDFVRTSQVTCLRKVVASQPLVDELNGRTLHLTRERFAPFLTAQAVVSPAGSGQWDIADLNSQYVMRQENMACKEIEPGSEDGSLVPCLCLYPVYYEANARATEQIVKSELGRVKNRQSQGSIAPEDFYVAWRQAGMECKTRFIDFPGGNFQNQEQFDVNGVKRALAGARGVILVLDTTTLLSPEGRLVAGQQFMKNYALVVEEMWKMARLRKEIVPVWLVLSKGDIYADAGPSTESRIGELTQQLQRMASEPLQGLCDMVSMLPAITDHYTENVRQLHQKIYTSFRQFFGVLQKNYAAVVLDNMQKKRRRLLAVGGLAVVACVLALEAQLAYRWSRARLDDPTSFSQPAAFAAAAPGEQTAILTATSQRLLDLWQSPRAFSYHWCYREAVRQQAAVQQQALADLLQWQQRIYLGEPMQTWRLEPDKDRRRFDQQRWPEIVALLACRRRLEALAAAPEIDLLAWHQAQAWNKESGWHERIRLCQERAWAKYPPFWRKSLAEAIAADVERICADASGDLGAFLQRYREEEDCYGWQSEDGRRVLFADFDADMQERLRGQSLQQIHKRWLALRAEWDKRSLPDRLASLQNIYRYWPHWHAAPDVACPDMYEATWETIVQGFAGMAGDKPDAVVEAADTLLGQLYNRCQVAGVEKSLERHIKAMHDAEKNGGERLLRMLSHAVARWLSYPKSRDTQEAWKKRLEYFKKFGEEKRVVVIFKKYQVEQSAFKDRYAGDWLPYIRFELDGKEVMWKEKDGVLTREVKWKPWTTMRVQIYDENSIKDYQLLTEEVALQKGLLLGKIEHPERYVIYLEIDAQSVDDNGVPQWLLDIYRR